MEIYYITESARERALLQERLSGYGVNIRQIGDVSLESELLSEVSELNFKDIASEKVRTAYRRQISPVICLTNGIVSGFNEHRLEDYLAYMDSGFEHPELFTGVIKGKLSEKPRGIPRDFLFGENGLRFIPEGYSKTFAEFDTIEYLEWEKTRDRSESAVSQFADWIKGLMSSFQKSLNTDN